MKWKAFFESDLFIVAVLYMIDKTSLVLFFMHYESRRFRKIKFRLRLNSKLQTERSSYNGYIINDCLFNILQATHSGMHHRFWLFVCAALFAKVRRYHLAKQQPGFRDLGFFRCEMNQFRFTLFLISGSSGTVQYVQSLVSKYQKQIFLSLRIERCTALARSEYHVT